MDNNKKDYFSQEKQEKAQKWLNEKWKNRVCEICGHNDWIILDFLSNEIRYEGGSLTIGGKIAPNVSVVCKHCGNTKFFNAGIIGLLNQNKEEE